MTENEKLTAKLNELARIFYHAHGYQVPEGYRFDECRHPQERGMFRLAELAHEFLVDEVPANELIEE